MKGFIYVQLSGELFAVNGDFTMPLGAGYAGALHGLNNPELDGVRNIGPLPEGEYRMRVYPHPRFAEPAIKLVQVKGETHERSGFWIHGDNAKADRSASSGCPVFSRPVRQCIAAFIALGHDLLLVRAF